MWQTWFDKVSPLEYWKGRPLRWSEWCSRERVWHEIGLLITANWLSQLKSSFVKRKKDECFTIAVLLKVFPAHYQFYKSIYNGHNTIDHIIVLECPFLRVIGPLLSQIYFKWGKVTKVSTCICIHTIPHICHIVHMWDMWRKICHVEKFQISIHGKWGEIW